MRSRLRPAQRSRVTVQSGSRLAGVIPSFVRDEMSNTVNGILNATCIDRLHHSTIRYMKLHSTLKKLMSQRGESARKAAKACGVPLSTFAGYLKSNKRQVDPTHLINIARHYGVSVDMLLGLEDRRTKFEGLPTKKLFSRWVKLTIEDVAGEDEK